MNQIQIDTDNIADTTNNYDLALIHDATWESEVTKRSLVALIEETPKSNMQRLDAIVIIGIVLSLFVLFHVAKDTLIHTMAIYVLVKAVVSLIIAIFICTGLRHIWTYQKIKRRIFKYQTKPIRRRERSVLKTIGYLLSVFVCAGLIWTVFSYRFGEPISLITLTLIGGILFHSTNAKYGLQYIQNHLGYLLHHIQRDLMRKAD